MAPHHSLAETSFNLVSSAINQSDGARWLPSFLPKRLVLELWRREMTPSFHPKRLCGGHSVLELWWPEKIPSFVPKKTLWLLSKKDAVSLWESWIRTDHSVEKIRSWHRFILHQADLKGKQETRVRRDLLPTVQSQKISLDWIIETAASIYSRFRRNNPILTPIYSAPSGSETNTQKSWRNISSAEGGRMHSSSRRQVEAGDRRLETRVKSDLFPTILSQKICQDWIIESESEYL